MRLLCFWLVSILFDFQITNEHLMTRNAVVIHQSEATRKMDKYKKAACEFRSIVTHFFLCEIERKASFFKLNGVHFTPEFFITLQQLHQCSDSINPSNVRSQFLVTLFAPIQTLCLVAQNLS